MNYDALYKELILEHYHHPKNKRLIEGDHLQSVILNPSCGDQVLMQVVIKDGTIVDCAFQSKGCVISAAAASLLTEEVKNLSLSEIAALCPDDMLKLIGMPLGPTRLRCALLSLEALQKAVEGDAK